MGELSELDTGIVVVYLLAVGSIGIYVARRTRTSTDYFLAGRSIPGWVVGFSLIGTIAGSGTIIGHPGEVFRSNMWGLATLVMLLPVMGFVARYVIVFYRRTVGMSVYGYLEQRFGYSARLYGTLSFALNRILDVSITFYFLAVAISSLSGWTIPEVIVVVGSLTVVYTLVGGITAVVWTDVAQSLLLIGAGLLCLGVALFGAGVGPGAVVGHAFDTGKFSWGSWSFSPRSDNVWTFLMLSKVWALQRYATDQHMVQRYLIARSDREAVRGAWMAACVSFPVWFLFATVGACVWAFYDLQGGAPAEVLADPSALMPVFIGTELSTGAIGLIVAAVLAAAMSSLDSDMNSIATAVVDDCYNRLRPEADDRARLRVGRWVVCASGALSVGAAFQWVGVQSAVGLMTELFSVAAAGVLGLFLVGMLMPSVDRRGAGVAIGVTVVFTAWSTATAVTIPALGNPLLDLGSYNYDLNTKLIGVIGTLLFVAVAWTARDRSAVPSVLTIRSQEKAA